MANAAAPAPAALFATATPLKVACEKLLSVVALALCVAVALPVGTTMLLDSPELLPVISVVGAVVASATLCSEMTEATPPADVATLGMPVMMPTELVMVV